MAAVSDSKISEPSGGKVVGVTYGNVERVERCVSYLMFWYEPCDACDSKLINS